MEEKSAAGSKVRLEDVARAAGVCNATVSLCMLGRTRVSEATRTRVLAIAEQLGYRPNQAASLLARQRSHSRTGGVGEVSVAFLSEMLESTWSFSEIAHQQGVIGHTFRPGEFASPEAATRILTSRGIQGLIISETSMPWNREQRARFAWDRFSCVKVTRGLEDLPLHLVRHSSFDYMMATLRQVARRGYRDILVLVTHSVSPTDDEARLGAMLCFQHLHAARGVRVEWIEIGRSIIVPPEIRECIRHRAPEAIVALHWSTVYSLRPEGGDGRITTPFAAVLTTPMRFPGLPIVSGCDVVEEKQVRKALTVLLELVGRGEYGFPVQPMEIEIQPSWIEGETLPDKVVADIS